MRGKSFLSSLLVMALNVWNSYLNFASADEEALQDLSAACDPASFGHGQQTVFDETYRKARKLDTSRFASMIDIHSSGIAQHVSNELLEGKHSKRTLRFELYKLNVYGT